MSEDDVPAAHDIILGALVEIGDIARLMEIAYMLNEPGLFEVTRWIASLPDSSRRQLEAFVETVGTDSVRIDRPDMNQLAIRRVRR
jgi:hypothetical protein